MRAVEQKDESLRIYHASGPTDQVLNLVKIAACLGIAADLIDVSHSISPAEEIAAGLASPGGASVLDIGSLAAIITLEQWASIADEIPASPAKVLILATAADEPQSRIVGTLSRGNIAGIRPAGQPGAFGFAVHPLSAQLSGRHYGRSTRDTIALDIPNTSPFETIMSLSEGLSAFAYSTQGNARLFIWSTLSIFDMDRPLERELEFEQAADEYLPAIIFLRSAFGEHCWHNPNLDADIIIDDPLLARRYGFIDFPDLLATAKELGFHVTVAFIPWNYWRTRQSTLRAFRDHPDSFGICAHGCDHIKNEFRTSNYQDLLARSHLAAERMDLHRQRTGMGWDPLMVCPREDYTIDAMHALADSGHYLGMVNTGCIPRDLDSKRIRGSDLLQPVQDAFFGFPLFKRHYWSGISVFAMAAFLGKPAILVEHHDFFQDRYRALKDFVTQLRALSPAPHWSSIGDLARHTHARRRAAPGVLEVRFFTDQFVIDNPDPQPQLIKFRRRMPAATAIESITVNGAPVPFERAAEFLCFESLLQANAAACVTIRRQSVPQRSAVSRGSAYGAGVATRRLLSEVRDNWLSRSKITLRLANRLMQTAG